MNCALYNFQMKKITVYYIWLAFSILSLSAIAIITLKLPLHGDERHIVDTIRLFTANYNLEIIKDYPEVTPPFFFYFYATWSKFFGSSVESLRILTLLISLITWQLIFYLNSLFTKKSIHTLLLSLLVIVNPYFLGTSVFVFTDMPTIMFCLAAVIFFIKDKIFLFTIFSAFAILCRQYAVIFPLAVISYWLINFLSGKEINKTHLITSLTSFVPLAVFLIIWEGISPASGVKKWVIANSLLYNIDYINTYLTFSVVYCFPLLIIFFKKIKVDYRNIILAFLITLVLCLFPVKPSLATITQTDYKTVGYVHAALVKIFGSYSIILKIVLWIFLFIGCYINVVIIKRFLSALISKDLQKEMIFIILWILFLFIMPLSYQVWEKYLLLILPYFLLSIYNTIPFSYRE